MVGPLVGVVEDEELIRRVAEGDDRALSELYDRYSRPVYATGIRVLGDTSLAEDLVQDAFTSVWRAAGSFDPGRARFATWLYRIARNRAVDLNRRRRVRPLSAGEEPLRNVSGGPYFEGLSQREISRRTGIPLGTIKSRTTSALRRLHRSLVDPAAEESRHD
jgi:RNA polymerase sigma-70 factor (ECF subfamily)